MMDLNSVLGVPITVEEALPPGGYMILGGPEPRLFVHPAVYYAMGMSAEAHDIDQMRDPEVMVAASIRWQVEVIERAAREAELRLDLVMLQQDQRRLQREMDQEMARRLRMAHRGRAHDWRRDVLRRTAACHRCGITITEEMAYRLGIELPEVRVPGGRLSIMVDGEWHEVRGVGRLSMSREDGAR